MVSREPIACPSCGQMTKGRDFCEFCNMPLGLQGHIAPKEVLPRLQLPPPPPPPQDLSDIPVVLPAPPRVVAPKPVPARPSSQPAIPKTRPWLWLLAIGGVCGMLVVAVVLAEVVARLGGGSLFGGSGNDPATKTTERLLSAEQLAREKARSLTCSDATLDKMLELAKPKNNEVVIDLGCADGRLSLKVADKYGLGVLAWDNDRGLLKLTKRLAEEHYREKLIDAQFADEVLDVDLQKGDIIFLIKPERFGGARAVAQRMEPRWFALKKSGVRIVSTQPICHPHPYTTLLPFQPPDDKGPPVSIYIYQTPLD
jgi:hypothetical protein